MRCRVDVSSKAEVDRLVADAVAEHGRLDVLCNVAGIIHESPVAETTEADLDRVIAVNLKGVFFGCQAAAPVMVAQGSGQHRQHGVRRHRHPCTEPGHLRDDESGGRAARRGRWRWRWRGKACG